MAGVCYRPPDQEKAVDEAFLPQLQEVSHSLALVLIGDFNHLDICWDSGMAGGRQSGRFLESVEDSFLVRVIDGPTRGEALLDWVLINEEESIREVKIGGSLGCSDQALVEFVIVKNAGLAKAELGPCALGEQTSGCSRNCWMGSAGKRSLRAWVQNRAGSSLRTPF